MEPTTIIRRPIVTEKATMESTEHNRVTFEVDRAASKDQIRRAVESLYSVRVLSVATQNRRGQLRRNRFGFYQSKVMKRAIVKIHPDDRIELF
ncbi:MAG: 50S ribosomal protein L23 [Phycisphaeraceae bacterium]|nr:50S ribosomal protein L23 [Phycisphaeraceae bacterium]